MLKLHHWCTFFIVYITGVVFNIPVLERAANSFDRRVLAKPRVLFGLERDGDETQSRKLGPQFANILIKNMAKYVRASVSVPDANRSQCGCVWAHRQSGEAKELQVPPSRSLGDFLRFSRVFSLDLEGSLSVTSERARYPQGGGHCVHGQWTCAVMDEFGILLDAVLPISIFLVVFWFMFWSNQRNIIGRQNQNWEHRK